MFEHRNQPMIPRTEFLWRLARHAAVALGVVLGSLALGIFGYHGLEGLPWIDALVNAAMLLGGMGPVNELHTTAGKVFAAFYALYSGLVFLGVAGILFAPLVHRLLHRFHLEVEDSDEQPEAKQN